MPDITKILCPVCGSNEFFPPEEKDKYLRCRFCDTQVLAPQKEETPEEREEKIKYQIALQAANAYLDSFPPNFVEAKQAFLKLVSEFPTKSSAYWGLLRATYEIKYVYEQNVQGETKKTPICYSGIYVDFTDDVNYKKALELEKDEATRNSYIAEATRIQKCWKKFIEDHKDLTDYDVFISFKSRDVNGEITFDTEDKGKMKELYDYLTGQGIKVFFAPVTMQKYIGEPYFDVVIYNAIETSEVMILYGSKAEYFGSPWIKLEWMRFKSFIAKGSKQNDALLVIRDGVENYDLPKELQYAQNPDIVDLKFAGDDSEKSWMRFLEDRILDIQKKTKAGEFRKKINKKKTKDSQRVGNAGEDTLFNVYLEEGSESAKKEKRVRKEKQFAQAEENEKTADASDAAFIQSLKIARIELSKGQLDKAHYSNALSKYKELARSSKSPRVYIGILAAKFHSYDLYEGIFKNHTAPEFSDESKEIIIQSVSDCKNEIVASLSGFTSREEGDAFLDTLNIILEIILKGLASGSGSKTLLYRAMYFIANNIVDYVEKGQTTYKIILDNIKTIVESSLPAQDIFDFFKEFSKELDSKDYIKLYEKIIDAYASSSNQTRAAQYNKELVKYLKDNDEYRELTKAAKKQIFFIAGKSKEKDFIDNGNEDKRTTAKDIIKFIKEDINKQIDEKGFTEILSLLMDAEKKCIDNAIKLENEMNETSEENISSLQDVQGALLENAYEYFDFLSGINFSKREKFILSHFENGKEEGNTKRVEQLYNVFANHFCDYFFKKLITRYPTKDEDDIDFVIKQKKIYGDFLRNRGKFSAADPIYKSIYENEANNADALIGLYFCKINLDETKLINTKWSRTNFGQVEGIFDAAEDVYKIMTMLDDSEEDEKKNEYLIFIKGLINTITIFVDVASRTMAHRRDIQKEIDAALKIYYWIINYYGKKSLYIKETSNKIGNALLLAGQFDGAKKAADLSLEADEITNFAARRILLFVHLKVCSDNEFIECLKFDETLNPRHKYLWEKYINSTITVDSADDFDDWSDETNNNKTEQYDYAMDLLDKQKKFKAEHKVVVVRTTKKLAKITLVSVASVVVVLVVGGFIGNYFISNYAKAKATDIKNITLQVNSKNNKTGMSKDTSFTMSINSKSDYNITSLKGKIVIEAFYPALSFEEEVIKSFTNPLSKDATQTIDVIFYGEEDLYNLDIKDVQVTFVVESLSYENGLVKNYNKSELLKIYGAANSNVAQEEQNNADLVIYKEALKLFADGDYLAAQEKFLSIVYFESSLSYFKECLYQRAIAYFNAGSYDAALAILADINDYRDAPHYIEVVSYARAVDYYEAGDYASALELFDKVEDYEDTEEYIEKCHYHLGIAEYNEGNYEEAYTHFKQANGYSESSDYIDNIRAIEFVEAENKAKDGNYQRAIEIYDFFELDDKVFYTAITNALNGTYSDIITYFNLETFTVPEEATVIAPRAFKGTDITSVTLNDNVTRIEAEAFMNCRKLTSITLPEKVNFIGASAFKNCTSLDEVIWNAINVSGGTSLVAPAFAGVGSISQVTFGEKVEVIPDYIFYKTNIETMSVPASLRRVGSWAFYGSTIETLNYSGEISDYLLINFADQWSSFPANKLYINEELVNDLTIPDKTTRINAFAFANNKSINRVFIPASLTEVGASAFLGCENISEVHFEEDIDRWIKISFENESSNPLYVGADLYINNDTLLTEVVIPNNVRIVPDNFLAGNKTITSVYFSPSVVKIGKSAFAGCSSINSITFSEGLLRIDERAFINCFAVTSINLPKSLTEIKERAFFGCLKNETLTLGDNLVEIGSEAFAMQSRVTSLNIKKSLEIIGDGAFSGMTGLTEITVDGENTNFVSASDKILYSNDRTIIYLVAHSCSGIFSIPSTVKVIKKGAFASVPVTSVTFPSKLITIEDEAFMNCTGLTSISLPSTVETLGKSAFENATNLSSITLSNSMTSIPDKAFKNTNIGAISINGKYRDIGESAFENAHISSLSIPSSTITSIGKNAFKGNSFSALTISNYIEEIGDGAFGDNTNLTSVIIGTSVNKLSSLAFSGDTKLSSVTIVSTNKNYKVVGKVVHSYDEKEVVLCPEGVSGEIYVSSLAETVKSHAFNNCSNITYLTLGDSVLTIEDNAISGVDNIVLSKNVKTIGNNAFDGTPYVFYRGSHEEFLKVNYGKNDGASIIYYSSTLPTDTVLTYWRYLNGVPTIWIII